MSASWYGKDFSGLVGNPVVFQEEIQRIGKA
jgi:hypothetical protein